MFAVIRTGGKQYRVAAEDKLEVGKIVGEPGEIIQFGDVLVVGGDSTTLGNPTVSGASVAAEVLNQGRGPKIIAFKKRRRKNSRRKRGHRQEFTLVRITEILTDGKKPTVEARKRPEKKPIEAPSADADDGRRGNREAESQGKTRRKGQGGEKAGRQSGEKARWRQGRDQTSKEVMDQPQFS